MPIDMRSKEFVTATKFFITKPKIEVQLSNYITPPDTEILFKPQLSGVKVALTSFSSLRSTSK